jgi:hypothetical protein
MDMTLSIRDMSGRLVKKLVPQNFNNLETEINLEGLSKGFYMISLDCGRIHKTKKLVVE